MLLQIPQGQHLDGPLLLTPCILTSVPWATRPPWRPQSEELRSGQQSKSWFSGCVVLGKLWETEYLSRRSGVKRWCMIKELSAVPGTC